MSQKLRQTSQMIRKFKQESVVIKPSQQVINLLKSLMEDIDTSISDLKEQNRLKYEEYFNDEKLLSKEIETFEKKIQSWHSNKDQEQNIKQNNQNDLNSKLTECDLLKEVVDFDVNINKFYTFKQSLNEIL